MLEAASRQDVATSPPNLTPATRDALRRASFRRSSANLSNSSLLSRDNSSNSLMSIPPPPPGGFLNDAGPTSPPLSHLERRSSSRSEMGSFARNGSFGNGHAPMLVDYERSPSVSELRSRLERASSGSGILNQGALLGSKMDRSPSTSNTGGQRTITGVGSRLERSPSMTGANGFISTRGGRSTPLTHRPSHGMVSVDLDRLSILERMGSSNELTNAAGERSLSLSGVHIPPPPNRSSRGNSAMGSGLIELVREGSQTGINKPSKPQEVVLKSVPRPKLWDASSAHARGWDGKHAPTQNPFVLRAFLEGEKDPWKNRGLYIMTPNQMSTVVEGLYCSTATIHSGMSFRPVPNDIIVCGVPRCGEHPVISALASLRAGRIVASSAELVDSVPWLEGAYTKPNTLANQSSPGERRIIKTHVPLRTAIGGETSHSYFARLSKDIRAIVILRHPADLRLSWFRHVRRVFNKYNPTLNFDQHFNIEEFAKVPRGALQPVVRALFEREADYEDTVAEVLGALEEQVHDTQHILIVFYEELLVNPDRFVRRLVEHTGLGRGNEPLIQSIVDYFKTHELNPVSGMRKGSTGQGRSSFTPKSMAWLDMKWMDLIKARHKNYTSYENLYEKMTKSPYPYRAGMERSPQLANIRKSTYSLLGRSSSSEGGETTAVFATNAVPGTDGERKRSSLLSMFTRKRGEKKASTLGSIQEHRKGVNYSIDPDDSDSEA